MKKIVISTCSVFVFSWCFSQNFSYQIFDQGNYSSQDKIIAIADGYLALNLAIEKKLRLQPLGLSFTYKFGVSVDKLDKDLKSVSKTVLFNGEKKLLQEGFDFFSFGKNSCLLYQDVADNEVGNVKLLTVDETSLKVVQDKVVIDFGKNNIEYDLKKLNRSRDATYHYSISAGNKMLMVFNEPQVTKDEDKIYHVTILDESLKVVAQRKINLKQVSDNVRAHSMIVDDFGNIYVAFKQYEEGEKKGFVKTDGHKIGSYRNRLLIIRPDGKQAFSEPVKLEGLSVRSLGLVYSHKLNKTYVMGSYSQGIDESLLGVFKLEINVADMKIGAITKTPFPDDLLAILDKDGFANRGGKNIGLKDDYRCTYFLRGDGTADVLMRYQERDERITVTNTTTKTSVSFYEGSLVDVHFIDGKVLFARIPRDMKSPGTSGYLGYLPYSADEKLLLFYNESERNIEKDIADKPVLAIVQRSEICAASIDKNGLVTRQLALKGYESKSIGVLPNSFLVYPNSVFLFIRRLSFMNMDTNDTKFAKVTIN